MAYGLLPEYAPGLGRHLLPMRASGVGRGGGIAARGRGEKGSEWASSGRRVGVTGRGFRAERVIAGRYDHRECSCLRASNPPGPLSGAMHRRHR